MDKTKAQQLFLLLKKHYPHAKMVLQWGNNFELLVAIILSAQCTDKKVNEVTAALFPKYKKRRKEFEELYEQYAPFILSEAKDPLTKGQALETEQKQKRFDKQYANYTRTQLPKEEMVELTNFAFTPLHELEQDVKPTGFYHNKAKSVQGAAQTVLNNFNGKLPKTIAELTTIPGVGRKTANVFLTNAYHIDEGIAVDTHVKKQANLLGLTHNTDPVKIEQDLMKLFPQKEWHNITYLLIEHGRNMRKKKSDRLSCGNPSCPLND